MKWFNASLFALSLSLCAPLAANAQPAPGPHHGAPGYAQHNDDHRNSKDCRPGEPCCRPGEPCHAGVAVPPPVVHHPAPAPHPAPVVHPAPAPHHPAPVAHPAPAPHHPAPVVHPAPAPHPAPVVHHPVPAPHHSAMHPHDFSNLKHSVENARFNSDKMDILRAAKHSNFFTSEQVRQLMLALTFDSDREEAAVMLYSNVVDKHNWFVIYDTLTFSSSRDSIDRKLGIR